MAHIECSILTAALEEIRQDSERDQSGAGSPSAGPAPSFGEILLGSKGTRALKDLARYDAHLGREFKRAFGLLKDLRSGMGHLVCPGSRSVAGRVGRAPSSPPVSGKAQ